MGSLWELRGNLLELHDKLRGNFVGALWELEKVPWERRGNFMGPMGTCEITM